MNLWYILDVENKPVKATTDEYREWIKAHANRKVIGKTNIGKAFISTVFLALDHSDGIGGLPILWETMIFSDDANDQFQERYTSQEKAVKGHEKAVRATIEGSVIEY